MKSNSNLLLSCSLLILFILSLHYNPLIKQLKGEEMEKKRATWLCLLVSLSLLSVPVGLHVCMQSLPVSRAVLDWGGSRWLFTKELSSAQIRSAWLEARKRNSNNIERKKVKMIWSFESSKVLPVWYWAVKQPLQINFLVAVFPAFCHQQLHSHPLHGLFSLTLCLALSGEWWMMVYVLGILKQCNKWWIEQGLQPGKDKG